MDLLSLLATVILFTTVGTLVVALAAYAAYKLREKRKPVKKKRNESGLNMEPIFLEPFRIMANNKNGNADSNKTTNHHADPAAATQTPST